MLQLDPRIFGRKSPLSRRLDRVSRLAPGRHFTAHEFHITHASVQTLP